MSKKNWDNYFYPNTDILKNKFNITEKKELERIEVAITDIKLAELESIKYLTNVLTYEDYKFIHKHIFEDLYDWAGKERNVNIKKEEIVLNGLSVNYSDYKTINKNGNKIIKDMNSIKWNKLNLDEKATLFTKKITQLWKNHSFREGNTRATIAFAVEYGKLNGFPLDKELFLNNREYLRNSLVLASIDYPEEKYLIKIIKESMEKGIEIEMKSDVDNKTLSTEDWNKIAYDGNNENKKSKEELIENKKKDIDFKR